MLVSCAVLAQSCAPSYVRPPAIDTRDHPLSPVVENHMLAQHGWARDTYRIEFQPARKLALHQQYSRNQPLIMAADTMVFAIPRECDLAYYEGPPLAGGCEVVVYLDSQGRKVLLSLMTQ
jgi:hypothetical protein